MIFFLTIFPLMCKHT